MCPAGGWTLVASPQAAGPGLCRSLRSHLLLSVPRSLVLLLTLPLQAGLAASTLLLVALLTAGGLAQLPLPPLLLQPLALLLRPPLLLQPAVLLLLLRGTHSARCAPAPPVPARGCSDSHTLPDP